MGPVTDKVATADSLPQETKIAIIGGGVIGVSTALFWPNAAFLSLSLKRGDRGEQSSRNWGGAAVPGATAGKCPHRRKHATMGRHE